MSINQKNLNLKYITPTVTVDGTNVFIRNEGNVPIVNFFQVRVEEEKQVHADVVSSVRFNNLDQLKNLSKLINDTIKDHENREK